MKRTSRRASRAVASLLRLACIVTCYLSRVAVAETELLWNSSVPGDQLPNNTTVTAVTAPVAGQRTSNDSAPFNITNERTFSSQPNATGVRIQASKAAGRAAPTNTSAPTPAATSAPQRPAAPTCRAAGSAKPSAGAAAPPRDSTKCSSGRVSVRAHHPPPSCEAFHRAPPAPLCRSSRACASLGACPSLPSCSPPSASPCASQSRAG